MKQTLIFILTLFYSIASIAEDAQLAAIFDRYETEGTILISSIGGEKEFIYNESRAGQRFAVASTFKILNSLIALEEKIVLKKCFNFPILHDHSFPTQPIRCPNCEYDANGIQKRVRPLIFIGFPMNS
mgnify:CR=1 FL=1